MSALSSITDVAQVRTAGGLSSDDSMGGATAAMIEAAIAMAQRKLKKAVGSDVYATVLSFSDSDLEEQANEDQQDAFAIGEAYFALAALPQIAKLQQIGQNGIPTQAAVGQGTIQFAMQSEADASAKVWTQLAYEAIADYLIRLETTDDTNDLLYMENPDDTGVESEDGEFSFLSI